MARAKLNKTAFQITSGGSRRLALVPGRPLYVLEPNGLLDRVIDPLDVAATETLATVYATETGGTTLTQPLTSDTDGRFPGWVDEESYDLYAPTDSYSPIERFEAVTGSTLVGGGSGDLASLTDVDATSALVDGAVLGYDDATGKFVGRATTELAVDAKGDLLAGSAADTLTRIPSSGLKGRQLTEDPSTATGLRWRKNRERLWTPDGGSETMSRASRMDAVSVLLSGRLSLFGGAMLLGGTAYAGIAFMSSSAAAVTPTNQWFCIADQENNVLAKTVDDTTTAWPSNTVKRLLFGSPYTPSDDVAVRLGVIVVAGTVPNFLGAPGNAGVLGVAPMLAVNANAGLTNPASLGATTTVPSAAASVVWGYVS